MRADLPSHEFRILVQGLSAIAIGTLGMKHDESAIPQLMIEKWEQFGRPQGTFAEAAVGVTMSPQPFPETRGRARVTFINTARKKFEEVEEDSRR